MNYDCEYISFGNNRPRDDVLDITGGIRMDKRRRVTLESTQKQKQQKQEHMVDLLVWIFALVIAGLCVLVIMAFGYTLLCGG